MKKVTTEQLKALNNGSKIELENGTVEILEARIQMKGIIGDNAFKAKSAQGEFEYYYSGLCDMINKDISEGYTCNIIEA
jgi:hypothetical protein